jgi:hypothetical protein
MQGISLLAEDLLASQEGLSSMELVSQWGSQSVCLSVCQFFSYLIHSAGIGTFNNSLKHMIHFYISS